MLMSDALDERRVPPRSVRPAAFAELGVSPEVSEKSEARGGRVSGVVGRGKQHADNVVAEGRGGESHHASVDARGACDLSLLAKVYVRLRRGEPVGGARLHFDEAERLTLVCDQINLRLHDCAAAVAPDAEPGG